MAKQTLSSSEMASSSDEFEAIYESNQPLIYRFMFWRTKDQMLAEDLTGNVFEKAWRTRQNFNGGSAKAWLFKIAHTTLIDHWRKAKEVLDDGSVIDAVEAEQPELGELIDSQLAVAQLQKALNKLPQEMNRVVKLRFMQGLSVRQTAQEINISEANVRVIQYRALQKLRDHLL